MLVIAFGALLWLLIMQRRESAREHQRLLTEQQIQESKQKHLEEELRRQKAEHEKQEAERQALELKSQMFHSIGIMAKSYAHNIKNLLVRPNDLLRRCMEEHPSAADSSRMLQEIQQTLGIVTERLQEILQTVQRDPSKFERVEIDLNALVSDLYKTWAEQAETKWKMVLEIELHSAPLLIHGDNSHLQQTLENFLFNARDAISEMRNYLRKQARPEGAAARVPLDEAHRQALIAAAGWKGRVLVRTTIIDGRPTMEIRDNGIGMTTEARIHCMEPHFSTKRNNALYAGLSAGMGLGLSFVQMILEQHGATIEVESELLQGALFRVKFPPNPTATT
jgi:signal transduction histidine kinase